MLHLLPPGLRVRAEVGLRPRGEGDNVVGRVAMGERQRERRRATNDLAGEVVLGAMARADVLVGGAVPRHDAAEGRAHGVDGVVLNRAILLHDQVVRVALEALHQRATGEGVLLRPLSADHVIAQGVLRPEGTAAPPSSTRFMMVRRWRSGTKSPSAAAAIC